MDSFHRLGLNQKKVHRRLAGKALIYVGSVGFAFCSWEGRPPCRPVPMRESLTGLSALGDSWIFMWFPKCPRSTRRSTLPTVFPRKCRSTNTDPLQKALRLCASARDNSVCSVSLPNNLLRTMTLQPISKKSNTTSIFPQRRRGAE